MPHPQAALHGDELLRALTAVALEVQRGRTVDEVLSVAGRRLQALGFAIAVLESDGPNYTARAVHGPPRVERLIKLIAQQRAQTADSKMLGGVVQGASMHAPDVGAQVEQLFAHLAPEVREEIRATAQQTGLKGLMISPLFVNKQAWGGLAVIREELQEPDTTPLSLFALQLGAALEMAQTMERLELRTSELDLVHALASAPPDADAAQLTQSALRTVCHSTASDAAVLHRYDAGRRHFEKVGLFGAVNARVEREWSSFPMDAEAVASLTPVAMPASDLPLGSQEVAAAGFHEVAIVPLKLEGRPSGMLTLVRRDERPYAPADLHAAEILGVQALSLLARTALYEDLKRSYAELEKAQSEVVRHERLAALGELAAVMAHEVRNPLGVIFNSLTTLKRLLTPTGDAKMLLEMVGEEAERLNRIVGDLLDFVRPYEVVKRPVVLDAVLAAAIDAAQKTAAAPGVRVTLEVPADLPQVPMDPHLIRQALENLVVNAVQAMPAGGLLTVRASVEPRAGAPWVQVAVSDQGVGLPQKLTEDIFAPFVTTKATGTGLGLAVVKRIVDAHHGEVAAQPNPDGRGATFVVKLPTALSARERLLTPPASRPSAPRK